MKRITLIIVSILMFVSCADTKEVIPINKNNLLLGYWQEKESIDNRSVYKRVSSLEGEMYGLGFLERNKFVRRHSGWCGTPPLVFTTFEGSFEENNALIKINVEDYPKEIQWEIISVTNELLTVERTLSEQEQDHAKLMELFQEINSMATSVSCTNSNDWTFTAYGAKACGGPKGYIAYSKTIDEALFLNKVNEYTAKEDAYNKKWGISSDCQIVNAPKGITCTNGSAILTY